MISTRDFIDRLCALDTSASDTLRSWVIDLDVPLLLTLLSSTPFLLIATSDGPVSTVAETDQAADFSRQTGTFDFHTDGLYLNRLPDFVALHCVHPGVRGTVTGVSDTVLALQRINPMHLQVLKELELVYVGRDGTHTSRPLVRHHPRSGDIVLNLGARAFIRPRSPFVTLRQQAAALNVLFRELDDAVVLRHRWTSGTLLFFDNNRYVHQRLAVATDHQRTLLRFWLSLAVPPAA